MLDAPVAGWTPENLVLWLDRKLRQIDIPQGELLKWLRQAVSHLVQVRKLSVGSLMRAKFVLATKLAAQIAAARKTERAKSLSAMPVRPRSPGRSVVR